MGLMKSISTSSGANSSYHVLSGASIDTDAQTLIVFLDSFLTKEAADAGAQAMEKRRVEVPLWRVSSGLVNMLYSIAVQADESPVVGATPAAGVSLSLTPVLLPPVEPLSLSVATPPNPLLSAMQEAP